MNHHRVNTCRLNIAYNNEKKARVLQTKVSQIFHATLSRTIHEVLDGFDTHDSLYIISKLEIDLGEIKEAVVEQELPRRLKEKLTEILSQSDITNTPNQQPKVITTKWSAAQQYITALENFLLTGQMPWQYRSIAASYSTFIDKILTEHAAALAALVTKHITHNIFLERLINQFGSTNIERVIHILAPQEARVIIETVHYIREVEVKEKILAVPRSVFEQNLWQLTLLYLVQDRGTYFNTKDFVLSIIKGLAARNNVDFVQYLRQIHQAVQYLTLYHTFRHSFPNILEDLYQEFVSDAEFIRQVDPKTTEHESALYEYLAHGFLTGNHSTVSRNELEACTRQDKHASIIGGITAFLRKHIRHDEIRRRTILLIKEDGAKKVVTYIEPAHSQFIFSFADKLQNDQNEKRLDSKADTGRFNIIKWDFIIATLLTSRGSVFNTREFVISTIQAIANRYGLQFGHLLTSIAGSIPDHTPAPAANNLIAALRQIKAEHDNASQRNTISIGQPSAFRQLIQQLSQKAKTTAEHKKEILALFTTLYTSPNKQTIAWLEKNIADGAIATDKILIDAALSKKLSALSSTLTKALNRARSSQQQAKKKETSATQLLPDLYHAIDKLSDTPGAKRRALSRNVYQWLTQLLLTEPELLSGKLRQQLSSPAFQQNIWLTENESAILQQLLPSIFSDRTMLYTPGDQSKKNNELYLSILQYYAIHQSQPWWAGDPDEQHHIDHIVLALLKQSTPQTQAALIQLAKDKQKRDVLFTALSSRTIATLAHRLGKMQQPRLEYYLHLIDQVNKQTYPVHAQGQSIKPDQWSIIMEALLQDRGSRFNLKAFLKVTLKKFAAHVNKSYVEMLGSLHKLIDQSEGTEKENFQSLLSELSMEQTQTHEKPDQNARSETPADYKHPQDTSPQHPKPFWQHLQQNLNALNTPANKATAVKELETIFQQLNDQNRTELLSTLRSLHTAGYDWPTLWSLLDDASLANLFTVLTADALFIRNYLTDWDKIMLQHFSSARSKMKRMYYVLTLAYSIAHQTIDKHRWFSFLLTRFETYLDQKFGRGMFKHTISQHFSATHNLHNSTIHLSFKKWIETQLSEPLREQPEQPATADNTRQQQVHHEAITVSKPFEKQKETGKSTQDQWIQNCGLVLIWPFMERYFTLLDLLENRQFKSPENAYRAVHLLQYLATGKEGHPEYQLVLNKMLCNVNTAKPLIKDLELTEKEKSLSENLLAGVIQNWSILGSTSVDGLRSTFLMRDGLLKSTTDTDTLHVKTKAFDVLIDKIPWGYTTVKLPWMEKPIFVVWR